MSGSGGSWKVAYADFVTAMMAFFLVMWIGAQDVKTRQSVANYFVDPSGVTKKPVETGAVLESNQYGITPKQNSTELGRGRESHNLPGQPSPPTKIVHDWIKADDARRNFWRDRAQSARDAAATSQLVMEKKATIQEVAIRELSKQLRTEVSGGAGKQTGGVYQDLLFGSFSEVNWTEIAEDFIK